MRSICNFVESKELNISLLAKISYTVIGVIYFLTFWELYQNCLTDTFQMATNYICYFADI